MNRYINVDKQKKATHKFTQFYTDYKELDGAGIYLGEEIVLIDFDGHNENEKEIVDAIVDNYPTLKVNTTRGYHLYYKRPAGLKIPNVANYTTLAGLKVDMKNGNQYGIIKLDGKERTRNREDLNLEDLMELPIPLYPYSVKDEKTAGMGQNGGRNNLLYKLARACYSKTQSASKTEELARFINNVCFSVPLDEKELQNTISSSIKEETIIEITPHDKNPITIAQKFSKIYNVHMYKGFLYFKKRVRGSSGDTIYKFIRDDNELDRLVTSHVELQTAKLKEVRGQLTLYSKKVPDDAKFLIRVNNGVIDENGNFIPIADNAPFTPFYLDVDYNEGAFDENVDNFLQFFSQGKGDLLVFLVELLGHLIMIRNFPPMLLFFVGDGSNGKSTFMEMITKFAGNLTGHVDINGFEDDTQITSLVDKLVNIADDIDPKYVEKAQKLKTMATGNTISVRPIYRESISIVNTASLLFTCNELPSFKDKTGGTKRRVKIFPCDAQVTNGDPTLLDKLSTNNAKSYILNLAIAGMKSIIKNGYKFSRSETMEDVGTKFFIEADNLEMFIREHNIDRDELIDKETKKVYARYKEFCYENNYSPISSVKFSNSFCKKYNLSTQILWSPYYKTSTRFFVESEQ